MKYRIMIDDNFHYMEEDEHIDGPDYESCEEAIDECKRIVDKSLRWERLQSKDPNDADELYDRYTDFGDDPFVRSDDRECSFSAWNYAKQRCKNIVKENLNDSELYI